MMSFANGSNGMEPTGLLGGVLIKVGISAVSLFPRPSCEVTTEDNEHAGVHIHLGTHLPVPMSKHSRHS